MGDLRQTTLDAWAKRGVSGMGKRRKGYGRIEYERRSGRAGAAARGQMIPKRRKCESTQNDEHACVRSAGSCPVSPPSRERLPFRSSSANVPQVVPLKFAAANRSTAS